jgi:hypothetical protein
MHGLAQGDFELALRCRLGEGAPLSKASIARLPEEGCVAEHEAWAKRSLTDREVVSRWPGGG